MSGFYQQQYENAGPIARPVIQRSQYLADALRALQNTNENPIRSRSQLGVNLLAQALTQWQQHRAQSQLQNATEKDALTDPLTLAWSNGGAPPASTATVEEVQTPTTPPMAAALGGGQPPAPNAMAQALSGPPPAPQQPSGPGGAQQFGASPTGLYTGSGPMQGANPQATGPGSAPSIALGPMTPVGDEAQWAQHLAQTAGQQPQQPPPVQQTAPSPPADVPPPSGAPPAAPMPSNTGAVGGQPPGMPTGRGMSSITPEQRQYVTALLQNPRTHAQGVALAQQLTLHAMAPTQWRTATQNGVTIFYDPENPSQHFAMPADQATRTRVMSAQEAGIGAAPGTMVSVDPNGNTSIVYQPPAGMQQDPNGQLSPRPGMSPRVGPADPNSGFTPGTVTQTGPMGDVNVLQSPPTGYRGAGGGAGPVPQGPSDIHAPQNALPIIQTEIQRVTPLLGQVRDMNGYINAARSGAQQQNGAGDIALVNGLQHLIDTGIVRQEDMNNQLHGFGLPGTIQGTMQFLRGNGQFSPEQRRALLTTAERLYGPRLGDLRAEIESRRPFLNQLDPHAYDYVVPPSLRQQFGWEPRPGQHPQQPHHAAPPQPTVQGQAPRRTGRARMVGP